MTATSDMVMAALHLLPLLLPIQVSDTLLLFAPLLL